MIAGSDLIDLMPRLLMQSLQSFEDTLAAPRTSRPRNAESDDVACWQAVEAARPIPGGRKVGASHLISCSP